MSSFIEMCSKTLSIIRATLKKNGSESMVDVSSVADFSLKLPNGVKILKKNLPTGSGKDKGTASLLPDAFGKSISFDLLQSK